MPPPRSRLNLTFGGSLHRVAPNPPSGVGSARPQSARTSHDPSPPGVELSQRLDVYPSVGLQSTGNCGGSVEPTSAGRAFGGTNLLATARAVASSGGAVAGASAEQHHQQQPPPQPQQQQPTQPAAATGGACSAWAAASSSPAEPPKKAGLGGMGGLAARFQLAAATAGVGGKGIKSIADVAKPAIKAKGGLNALLTRSPLDGALTESTRAITDARRAMAEGEINLNKLYALDHDGMMTARGLLVGSNKAITKLISASEALMTIADEARKRLEDDKKALRDAGNQSIRQLTAQREMLATTLLAELAYIEQNTTFSIVALLGANQKLERDVALGLERQKQVEEMLGSSLGDLGTKHTQYVADHEKYH